MVFVLKYFKIIQTDSFNSILPCAISGADHAVNTNFLANNLIVDLGLGLNNISYYTTQLLPE